MPRRLRLRSLPRRIGSGRRNHAFELDLQTGFVGFLARHYPMIRRRCWFVHNGAFLAGTPGQRINTMKRLKAAGLTPGVFDLHFILPGNDGRLGVLESKWDDNDLTDSQRDWGAAMADFGVAVGSYRTIPEGLAVLRSWGFTDIRVTDMGGGVLRVDKEET